MDVRVVVFVVLVGAATLLMNAVRLVRPARLRRPADSRQLLLGVAMVVIAALALILGQGWSANAYALIALCGGSAAVWTLTDLVLARRSNLR